MARPVITQPPSPRIVGQGIPFTYAPTATNDPDRWTATGLPNGWLIDPDTGVISGKALASGESTVVLQAHILDDNEEIVESSDPVSFVVVIMATPPGSGGPLELLVDWETVTGDVSIPGVPESEEGGPIMKLKQNDRFPLLIGIKTFGVLMDVGSEVSLRLGFKEFEPDALISITADNVEKVGTAPDLTRYRIWLHLTEEAWRGVLSNYEDDRGTQVLAYSELRLEAGTATETYNKTKESAPFTLQGGLGEDSYLPVSVTLLFDEQLEYAAAYGFSIVLALEVTGRPVQNVQLSRTLDVAWNGSEWVVSDLAGPTSVQAPSEGTQWRATLHSVSVTGGASGVTVDCEVTTTEDANDYLWDVNLEDFLPGDVDLRVNMPFNTNGGYLHLFDGSDVPLESQSINGYNPESPGQSSYANPNNLCVALVGAWTGADYAAGGAEVVGRTTIRLNSTGIARKQYVGPNVMPDPQLAFGPIAYPGQGTPRSAKIVGTMTQTEMPPGGQITRASNTFRVAVDRNINPKTA